MSSTHERHVALQTNPRLLADLTMKLSPRARRYILAAARASRREENATYYDDAETLCLIASSLYQMGGYDHDQFIERVETLTSETTRRLGDPDA